MSERPSHSPWRIIALIFSVLLLIAAAYVALQHVNIRVIVEADQRDLTVIAAAVVLNLLLSGLLFWLVTLSFDADPPVSLWRMTGLICASALLNYLPLRAGLVGRSAFLKLRHNLPLRQSMLILLIVLGVSSAVLGGACAAVLIIPPAHRVTVTLLGVLVMSVLAGPLCRLFIRRRLTASWSWVPVRVADLLVSSVRLYVAFRIVHHPIAFDQAVIISAAGMFVSLVGLTPNGLGLREWVIAALANSLAITTAPAGLAAALVDRAVEAIVLIIAGMVSLRLLAKEE